MCILAYQYKLFLSWFSGRWKSPGGLQYWPPKSRPQPTDIYLQGHILQKQRIFIFLRSILNTETFIKKILMNRCKLPAYSRFTNSPVVFLVNKTNRCTEFQFYWYYDSICFGQLICPSSRVLSHTSALVHFMQLWWPCSTRSRIELRSILLLVANGHNNCIKCTKVDIRLRTPDDGQKCGPKHVQS